MGLSLDSLGLSRKRNGGGIRLGEAEPWRVSPTKDVELFVRTLPVLVPEGSLAYFEGTGESHVAKYLSEVSVPAQMQVALGTIWPRPDYYHVPVSQESMEALAAFLDDAPTGTSALTVTFIATGPSCSNGTTRSWMIQCTCHGRLANTSLREFANGLGSTLSSGWL